MKSYTLSLLMFLICGLAPGQNLIGFDAKSIQKYMKENRKDMIFEKVINTRFNYLKYSDNSDNQTIFFFLGADSVCKSEKVIVDLRVKAEKVKEFNSVYRKNGEYSWIDTRYGKDYRIEIKDEPWYSVVTIVPMNNL